MPPVMASSPQTPRRPLDSRIALTRSKARQVYDKFGSKANDAESAYGSPTTELLIELSRLEEAEQLVEFGHGSGAFAYRLFERNLLPPSCQYTGVDQSTTMADRAAAKLHPYKDRVELRLTNGAPADGTKHLADASVDRYISTYVLDLLSEEDVLEVLEEARRLLRPEGLLCVCGITYGTNVSSRLAAALWDGIFWWNKEIVGGCRPQRLAPYLEEAGFEVREQRIIQGDQRSFVGCMNNEVVVATPRSGGRDSL
eukprot:CAMPEP_0118956844 /NCGR_PEP_ID=MMETSP1169-20130426/61791_1 /TAXON_ID=36882 /ORGANISM="Pyramimonas obovata, Strain CCMP722" /LENGTH=254 /DNA_ID=CAMNT_0006904893 /DNA_START=673 /DNA_END=1437 /DNA_ORIENTATION=-